MPQNLDQGSTNREDDVDIDDAVAVFASVRRRLFGIAYRMLGTSSDADDIVQDVWVRWQTCDRSLVLDPPAFLATATTRLAINVLQSAHSRRETYIGPWLPEPVNTSDDPALGAERGEALGFAMLLLLEKLTPTERAAYILREAFDYPYEQIAQIVQLKEPATRQLVSRARKKLTTERRVPVESTEQRRLLAAFLQAAQQGDVTTLEELFASDVVSYSDGNGVRFAARIPVHGRSRVAKFIAAFSTHFWTGKTIDWVELNGQQAVTLTEDGTVTTALTMTVGDDGIQQLMWIMNPDKLGHVASARA
ncbi:RNA polymerase sigma-70 factor [Lacisediminihabitans profunda]|uniref:RNA polymerase sigma-70 factor n=1 Tax=Lacisediminihabitans profunda TaxID=2594790 RepID=A0A5C8UJT4_9MICO|nr:RNA polymerase sigma-70 factor [Lacisediminihabitans profunda]TXN28326.1 RNA polymerase sigma-70 factor [Lacisediminihabitans profunda]